MSILHSTDAIDIVDCESAFSLRPWFRLQGHDFTLDQPYFRLRSTKDDDNDNDGKASPRPKKKQRIVSTTDLQTQERHDNLLPFLHICMNHSTSYWQQAAKSKALKKDDQHVDLPSNGQQQQEEEKPMINFPDWIPMASALRRFQHNDKLPLVTLGQGK
jgi:hypothetical protein